MLEMLGSGERLVLEESLCFSETLDSGFFGYPTTWTTVVILELIHA